MSAGIFFLKHKQIFRPSFVELCLLVSVRSEILLNYDETQAERWKDIAVTPFTWADARETGSISSPVQQREAVWRAEEEDLMRQRDHSLLSDLASITGTSCLSTLPRFLTEAACFQVSSRKPGLPVEHAAAEAFTLWIICVREGIFRKRGNLQGVYGMKWIP